LLAEPGRLEPSEEPRPGLWDSFWADHASSDQLFHQLLWRIRFLFSRAYALALYKTAQTIAVEGKLLEVGCGSATTLHFLSHYLPNRPCLAFDLSPQALSIVRQRSPSFRRAVSDARWLPLEDGAVALSFSIGLIEHFDRRAAAEMLQEMIRVTEPGGWVAVMVPWRSSFYNSVRRVAASHWPFGHENPFRRGELRELLRGQGLQDVSLQVIYFTTLLAIGRINV
jgi:SAM-dependent methyltransferase